MLQVSRPKALRFEACLKLELQFLKGLRPLKWMFSLQGRLSKTAVWSSREVLRPAVRAAGFEGLPLQGWHPPERPKAIQEMEL